MKLTVGQISGDGSNVAYAVGGVNSVPVDGEAQGVGVYGWATTASTSGNGSPDAAGMYAVGQTTGTSARVGIGIFAASRILSTSASAKGSAIQAAVRQDSGIDHSVNTIGFGPSNGVWMAALGSNLVAAAYQIGNPFGQQFDVGLHNNSQVNNSLTGGVKTAFIQDDGASLYSQLVKGTHASGAIYVQAGSGHVGYGVAPSAGIMCDIMPEGTGVGSLRLRRFSSSQSVNILEITDANGTTIFARVGPTGQLTLGEGININIGTVTGSQIGATTSQKTAFHGSAPVIQRAGAAQAAAASTASTQTTPWGYSTQAQADAIVTLVNELRAALVEKGLIKGAA